MKKIILHGILGKAFGKVSFMKVDSLRDIKRALESNNEKFHKKMKSILGSVESFLFVVDGDLVGDSSDVDRRIYNASVVEMIPVQTFNAFVSTAVAVSTGVGIGVGSAATAAVLNIAIAMAISVGISFLINKLLSPKNPKSVKTSAYIFQNQVNRAERNSVVPLGYGRLKISSLVISNLILNKDLPFAEMSPQLKQESLTLEDASELAASFGKTLVANTET
jgi:predicted phage tail protein